MNKKSMCFIHEHKILGEKKMKRKEKKNTDSKNGVKGICKPFFL